MPELASFLSAGKEKSCPCHLAPSNLPAHAANGIGRSCSSRTPSFFQVGPAAAHAAAATIYSRRKATTLTAFWAHSPNDSLARWIGDICMLCVLNRSSPSQDECAKLIDLYSQVPLSQIPLTVLKNTLKIYGIHFRQDTVQVSPETPTLAVIALLEAQRRLYDKNLITIPNITHIGPMFETSGEKEAAAHLTTKD